MRKRRILIFVVLAIPLVIGAPQYEEAPPQPSYSATPLEKPRQPPPPVRLPPRHETKHSGSVVRGYQPPPPPLTFVAPRSHYQSAPADNYASVQPDGYSKGAYNGPPAPQPPTDWAQPLHPPRPVQMPNHRPRDWRMQQLEQQLASGFARQPQQQNQAASGTLFPPPRGVVTPPQPRQSRFHEVPRIQSSTPESDSLPASLPTRHSVASRQEVRAPAAPAPAPIHLLAPKEDVFRAPPAPVRHVPPRQEQLPTRFGIPQSSSSLPGRMPSQSWKAAERKWEKLKTKPINSSDRPDTSSNADNSVDIEEDSVVEESAAIPSQPKSDQRSTTPTPVPRTTPRNPAPKPDRSFSNSRPLHPSQPTKLMFEDAPKISPQPPSSRRPQNFGRSAVRPPPPLPPSFWQPERIHHDAKRNFEEPTMMKMMFVPKESIGRPASEPNMGPFEGPKNVVVHIFLSAKDKMKGQKELHVPLIPNHGMPTTRSPPLVITKNFDKDTMEFVDERKADAMVEAGPTNIVEVQAMVNSDSQKISNTLGKAVNAELNRAIPMVMTQLDGEMNDMDNSVRKELEQALVDEIAKNLGDEIDRVSGEDINQSDIEQIIKEGFDSVSDEFTAPTQTMSRPIRTRPTTATTPRATTGVTVRVTTMEPEETTTETSETEPITVTIRPATATTQGTTRRTTTKSVDEFMSESPFEETSAPPTKQTSATSRPETTATRRPTTVSTAATVKPFRTWPKKAPEEETTTAFDYSAEETTVTKTPVTARTKEEEPSTRWGIRITTTPSIDEIASHSPFEEPEGPEETEGPEVQTTKKPVKATPETTAKTLMMTTTMRPLHTRKTTTKPVDEFMPESPFEGTEQPEVEPTEATTRNPRPTVTTQRPRPTTEIMEETEEPEMTTEATTSERPEPTEPTKAPETTVTTTEEVTVATEPTEAQETEATTEPTIEMTTSKIGEWTVTEEVISIPTEVDGESAESTSTEATTKETRAPARTTTKSNHFAGQNIMSGEMPEEMQPESQTERPSTEATEPSEVAEPITEPAATATETPFEGQIDFHHDGSEEGEVVTTKPVKIVDLSDKTTASSGEVTSGPIEFHTGVPPKGSAEEVPLEPIEVVTEPVIPSKQTTAAPSEQPTEPTEPAQPSEPTESPEQTEAEIEPTPEWSPEPTTSVEDHHEVLHTTTGTIMKSSPTVTSTHPQPTVTIAPEIRTETSTTVRSSKETTEWFPTGEFPSKPAVHETETTAETTTSGEQTSETTKGTTESWFEPKEFPTESKEHIETSRPSTVEESSTTSSESSMKTGETTESWFAPTEFPVEPKTRKEPVSAETTAEEPHTKSISHKEPTTSEEFPFEPMVVLETMKPPVEPEEPEEEPTEEPLPFEPRPESQEPPVHPGRGPHTIPTTRQPISRTTKQPRLHFVPETTTEEEPLPFEPKLESPEVTLHPGRGQYTIPTARPHATRPHFVPETTTEEEPLPFEAMLESPDGPAHGDVTGPGHMKPTLRTKPTQEPTETFTVTALPTVTATLHVFEANPEGPIFAVTELPPNKTISIIDNEVAPDHNVDDDCIKRKFIKKKKPINFGDENLHRGEFSVPERVVETNHSGETTTSNKPEVEKKKPGNFGEQNMDRGQSMATEEVTTVTDHPEDLVTKERELESENMGTTTTVPFEAPADVFTFNNNTENKHRTVTTTNEPITAISSAEPYGDETPLPPPPGQKGECPTPNDAGDPLRSDVVFLLDSSYAVNEDRFRNAIQLILDTVGHFHNIGPNGVQVSLVQYNTEPYLEFSLRKHKCKKWLLEDIADTDYMRGSSMLGKALEKVSKYAFTKKRGDRPDADNVLVIVTDGQSDDKVQEPVSVAREHNVTVLVIATLEANKEYLKGLAGHEDNVFQCNSNTLSLEDNGDKPLARKIAGRIGEVSGFTLPDGSSTTEAVGETVGSDAGTTDSEDNADSNQPSAETPVPPSKPEDGQGDAGSFSSASSSDGGDTKSFTSPSGFSPKHHLKPTPQDAANGVVNLDCSSNGFSEIHSSGTADSNHTIDFFVPADSCGVTRVASTSPAGHNATLILHLIHNRALVTGDDRAFILQCFVGEVVKETELQADLDVLKGEVLVAETISLQQIPPTCTYSIRKDSPTGPIVKKAVVGQKVFHRWECDGGDEANDVYGIHVHNCFASDDVEQRFAILDRRGCSADLAILSDPTYSDDKLTAVASSHVFAFQNAESLKFLCKVTLCTRDGDGCEGVTPPACNANITDLLFSPKVRLQNSVLDGALTSALSTQVGLSNAQRSGISRTLAQAATSQIFWILAAAVLLTLIVLGLLLRARSGMQHHSRATTVASFDPANLSAVGRRSTMSSMDISVGPIFTTSGGTVDRPGGSGATGTLGSTASGLRSSQQHLANERLAEFMKTFDRSKYV